MARNSPPTRPTSSPITITSGSAASSRSRASRSAATNPIRRSVSSGRIRVDLVRCEHRRQEVVGTRLLVGQGGLDRRLDLVGDRVANSREALVVELAELTQRPLQAGEGVTRLPLVDDGPVADVGEVGAHRVLHAPERLHLEEGGAVARAGDLEGAGDGVLDGHEVVAVHDLTRHPVPGGTIGEVLDGALGAPVCGQSELVVLADEHHRQPPGRREVHPFVRRALPCRAVAEERHAGPAVAAELCGQRRAAGMRDPGADDAVAAEDVEREIRDVHRAAEPLARARPSAEHLGHHPTQVGSGRDQVAVGAVVPDEVVRLAHDARRADRDRLLADAAVRRPDDHALLEQLGRPLLEGADQLHAPVLVDERRSVGRAIEREGHVTPGRRWGGGSCSSTTYPSGSRA